MEHGASCLVKNKYKFFENFLENQINAYLTIYLTLILALVLSLCLMLIEGSRQNAFYMEAECVTDIGLNSVLAEFHRELLTQYNLFAIDCSYGTAVVRTQNTGNRLEFYLKKNMSYEDVFLDWLLYRDFLGVELQDVSLQKVRLLTDGNGGVFRRRAAEAMWDALNLSLLDEWKGWMETIDSEQLAERDIAALKQELDEELDDYAYEEEIYVYKKGILETEWVTVSVDNPTDYLEEIRTKGILSWVVEDVDALSTHRINEDNLIGTRMELGECNQGNLTLEDNPQMDEGLERFLFQEYLLQYMGHYQEEKDGHALAYQIEYLLGGRAVDRENLEYVVDSIFALREVANTTYLYANQDKYELAEGLATLLTTLVGLPEAADVLTQILVLGWAFVESLYDVKSLLIGGRVPLIKTDDTWHYGLEGALQMGKLNEQVSTEGMSYEDYLRVLLAVEKQDLLTRRAMNMVEADIRQLPENHLFRLDGCIDALEACVRVKSVYGYSCQIVRQKGYSTQ
ncbi:MAG: hypothetical protein IJ794_01425 [Lachnospiraceae bacterium]|nr:hypothetical protein [Lachnospiraceae bacterium]